MTETLLTRLTTNSFANKNKATAPAAAAGAAITAVQELHERLAALEPLRQKMQTTAAEVQRLRPIASAPRELQAKLDVLLATRKGLLAAQMMNIAPEPDAPTADELAAQIVKAREELTAAADQAEVADFALRTLNEEHQAASAEYQAASRSLEPVRNRIASEWLEERAKTHLKAWEVFCASYVEFHAAGMAFNEWAAMAPESRSRLHESAPTVVKTPVAHLPRLGFTGADAVAVADLSMPIQRSLAGVRNELRQFLAEQG